MNLAKNGAFDNKQHEEMLSWPSQEEMVYWLDNKHISTHVSKYTYEAIAAIMIMNISITLCFLELLCNTCLLLFSNTHPPRQLILLNFLEFYIMESDNMYKSFYGHKLLLVLLGKYLGVEWMPHLIALASFHNSWFLVYSVSFSSKYILIYLLIYSLTHSLFRSVLLGFQIVILQIPFSYWLLI